MTTLTVTRALEMLALTFHVDQSGFPARDGERQAAPASTFLVPGQAAQALEVDGSPLRDAQGFVFSGFKSDTEGFVAESEAGDVVVVFRSSEWRFFTNDGALRDWVMTDFRANRIPYPPAPDGPGDRRWVHAGFWQAYETVRERLLAMVARRCASAKAGRCIHVTGFSLGGALALLAALDIAVQQRGTPVHLTSIAAPRAGDASLNRLLEERTASAWSIAYGGDPIVHMPPVGPNTPFTLKHLATINLGGFHVPIGNPVVPQIGQQYRTAGQQLYIDTDHVEHDSFPPLKLALKPGHHMHSLYRDALQTVRQRRMAANTAAEAAAAAAQTRAHGALHVLLAPPP